MRAILPVFEENSSKPLYLQLYEEIKQSISHGEIAPQEKLPSLRNLSAQLQVSLTTVEQAYNQLMVEGYIYSKANSGYFASNLPSNQGKVPPPIQFLPQDAPHPGEMVYDLSCFDFNKWKKCFNQVISYQAPQLLFPSDPQGEVELRREIALYLYQSRGVSCDQDQIVIAAGVQQITSHISILLNKKSIFNVIVEDPGYLPVRKIFTDRGFSVTPVSVHTSGIDIKKLPTNIPSSVYVAPSNQFPTGAVMPIASRYALLQWAGENGSYIIEDDYDSELRYFGRPIPALQGLDQQGRVIYLGSFSSTLYPSIKISYMVLPRDLLHIFLSFKEEYSQTSSKGEQLTLAQFMRQGYYQRGIRKLRRLYAQKLQIALSVFKEHPHIQAQNSTSGIHIILKVNHQKTPSQLTQDGKSLGILLIPLSSLSSSGDDSSLILYYSHIPKDDLQDRLQKLLKLWFPSA